jgi:cytochrome c
MFMLETVLPRCRPCCLIVLLWGFLTPCAWLLPSLPSHAAFDAHGGPVRSVAVSSDGRRALTASFDTSIILWDLAEQTVLVELNGHDAAVNAVAFLPDDQRALSGSDDGTVGLWDLTTGSLLARFQGHDGKVVAVAMSPDGRIAASAGWDWTLRLWDLEDLKPLHVLKGRGNMNTVSFSKDGGLVLAGTSDGSLQLWQVADGTQAMALDGHDFAVTGVEQSPDGGTIATSSVDETVQLWDSVSGEALQTLYGHEGPVLAVDMSADGRLVASGGVDGTVRVWKRGDGDRLKAFARHQGPVWSVTFTPDGKTLLSGGADGLILTYDLTREDEGAEQANGAIASTKRPAMPPSTRGERLFRICSACHTLTPDDGHKAGPTLHGLFGRTAGSHPGYRYSPALEESELVWTEDTVDRLFAIGPDHLLPGTKMPLQRMPNPKDRADLIAFLKRATSP